MPQLPDFVPPMLAKIGEPFSSDDWLFEIKWDGTRAIAFVDDDDYRLINRNKNVVKARYPELAFLRTLPTGTILDGEIIVLQDGKPDFNSMLRREQAHGERRFREMSRLLPATYVVFDLLYRDYEDVTDLTLVERRSALEELLATWRAGPAATPDEEGLDPSRLVFSEGIIGDGLELFEETCARELEGIVAKRLRSRYLPGKRTDSWLKIKRRQHVYAAIIGFLAEAGNDVRSLLIAIEEEGVLRYAGRVGSGLDEATRRELPSLLLPRVRPEPIVPCAVPATWVEPGLYCRVSFLEITPHGELRAPVFEELMRE